MIIATWPDGINNCPAIATRNWNDQMSRKKGLPSAIVLRTAPETNVADICAQFGVTRQMLGYLRAVHNFPASRRCGAQHWTITREIGQWCAERSISVIWT
ncbi:hypothetical protein [Bradyrhizobium uaiense]|uniref:Uncharacterized protein n=1 Tax=Bradyrhizobium uaiense TaxID=2594946 RepID=A0A6P1BTR6_9BRAD|nr:hypothetical protein [Bradyrhizobium uaiense]NEV00993.1 hypothetical protein [Bradyrhizobium uaiense]